MRLLLALLLTLLAALPAAAQPDPFYEVEALNAGLGDPPPGLDRETPQAAMESFLEAADDRDWDRAAHLLDLREVAPGDQPVQGPLRAAQLQEVLDRKVVLSWTTLLDRPDALDATASSDSAVAGQTRRSILLGVLDLEDRTVPIRLNRLRPGEGDPVWVFSRQSVENVPALYRAYGPTELERALPAWARRDAAWGLAWWEVIALPLVVILAVLAGAAVNRALAQGARRADGTWMEIVLRSLKWPATIAVVTAVLAIATAELFVFSAPVDAVVGPVIAAGFVIAAILFVMTVLDGILDQIAVFDPESLSDPNDAATRDRATALSATRRIVLVILALLGAGWVFSSAEIFRTFGFSLLASAGAVTLILGFAARRVLGNIMSSLQIAFNKSARIGDQIIYDGEWCTVERIHFTYVQLKHWTGNRIVVPVEEFVSEGFQNWSLAETKMLNVVTLRLAGTADVGALRERFREIAGAEEEILDQDQCRLLVTEHDALGQTLRFQFPTPDPSTGWYIECRIRERLIAAAAEIERRTDVPQFAAGAAADVAA